MRGIIGEILEADSTAWATGVALPIAMVVLDPAVFRGGSFGIETPLLGALKPFGYVAIAGGVLTVASHLLLRRNSAVVAGFLAAGCVFAATLGVVLLPFTFLGTFIFGIGLLGLSPFLSGLVVGWRARRAFQEASGPRRAVAATLAFVLFFGVCTSTQLAASAVLDSGVRDVCSGQTALAVAATSRLMRWRFLLDFDQLVLAWAREGDDQKKQHLAKAYLQLTGENIEERASRLSD